MSLKRFVAKLEEGMEELLAGADYAALAAEYEERFPPGTDPIITTVMGVCIGRLVRLGADPLMLASYIAVTAQMCQDAVAAETLPS